MFCFSGPSPLVNVYEWDALEELIWWLKKAHFKHSSLPGRSLLSRVDLFGKMQRVIMKIFSLCTVIRLK